MEFSGTQTIAAPIEKVWAFLMDVNNVASCAPGFQSLEVLGEEHWKAVVAVGVGAVKAKFTMDVTRDELQEPENMTMKGRGKAPGSAVDMSGYMHLTALDSGETEMESAVQHWNEILDARAQQMDAAYARLGRTSADFWERRARGFHRSTKDTVSRDPFYLRLSDKVNSRTSVLDVGAGTGRFSLALASQVDHIIAVEPSAAMMDFLRQDAADKDLRNISYVQTTWQEAPDNLQADIVMCSHVVYPIRDIEPFLSKLQKATQQGCYIYARATHIDALTADLWRHFHHDERCMPPSYIHVMDVLYEMGIFANVEIVSLPPSLRYPSLDVAVTEMTEQLILPVDETTRVELRALLEEWLVEMDGVLVPPLQEMVCAIIWWEK